MSKDIIKIRKKWLVDPQTQVHQPKNTKPKFFQKQERNLRNFEGNTQDIDFEELDEEGDYQ